MGDQRYIFSFKRDTSLMPLFSRMRIKQNLSNMLLL